MSQRISDLQPFIVGQILQSPSTHLITLNPNRNIPPAALTKLLRLWSLNVVCRLFRGAITRRVSETDLFSFTACMEFTPTTGRPHYHLMAMVDRSVHARLAPVAERCWLKLLKGGQCDVRELGQSNEDQTRAAEYITKNINQERCFEGFVKSLELSLASFCHSPFCATATKERG